MSCACSVGRYGVRRGDGVEREKNAVERNDFGEWADVIAREKKRKRKESREKRRGSLSAVSETRSLGKDLKSLEGPMETPATARLRLGLGLRAKKRSKSRQQLPMQREGKKAPWDFLGFLGISSELE